MYNYLNSNWDWSQPLPLVNLVERTVNIVLQELEEQQHQPQPIDSTIQKNRLIHQILKRATAKETLHKLPYLKGMTLLQIRCYAAVYYPDLMA